MASTEYPWFRPDWQFFLNDTDGWLNNSGSAPEKFLAGRK
jgi:hypothetical protein